MPLAPAITPQPRLRPSLAFLPPLSGLAALVLGGLAVLGVLGTAMLDPRDAAWMVAGPMGWDPTQYYLGWRFFAQAAWSWPPGLNPDYGLELASGIFFADAIPLIALPLKLLAPGTQQYWGLWLLACGALQGFFAWVLLGRATPHPAARLLGAGLFVLQPMMLGRMGGHLALAGQFTVLAALALALRPGGAPRRQGMAWVALLGATALIHSYLLVMVAAIWAADWLSRALRQRSWRPLLAEALAASLACLAALWLSGFFRLTGGMGAPGYGTMMLDLAGPFDSGDWGAFLPRLNSEPHPESGGLYLGLGAILILVLGGVCAVWRPSPRHRVGLIRRWPLLAAMLALLAFAATNNLTILGHTSTIVELPGWLHAAASTLRASERFVWPLLYLSLALAVAATARALGGARTAMALAAALAIQALDLRPGIRATQAVMAQAYATPQSFIDPFWTLARPRYDRIRAIPAENLGENWKPVATIAAQLRMATDAVYLARVDPAVVAGLQDSMAERLSRGRYEPRTLYVLRDAPSRARAMAGMNPARDVIIEVDGMVVLAPGWR